MAFRSWWAQFCLSLLAWQMVAFCQRSFTADFGEPRRRLGRTVCGVRERRQPGPRPRQRTVGDDHTPPWVITSRAKAASSASEILGLMMAEHQNPKINLISVSAAWTRLAKMECGSEQMTTHSFLPMFVSLTQSLLGEPSGQARAVANIFWATSRLQDRMPSQVKCLGKPLETAALATAQQMNAQEVANVIWAVEKRSAQSLDSDSCLGLLSMLAARVPGVISEMKAQNVANVIWAVAKLANNGAESELLLGLLPVVTDRLPAVAAEMTAQEVSNVIWAAAKLTASGADSEVLLDMLPVLASVVPDVISGMNSQHVANIIWATGQISSDSRYSGKSRDLLEILPAVVERAGLVLPLARPQEIANSCCGLALSNYFDAQFFEAVAAKVVQEASEWKPRGAELDLPEVLCAFAKLRVSGHLLGQETENLLDATAKKMAPILAGMNDWGLCALAWSFRELDLADNFFIFRSGLEQEVTNRNLSEEVMRSQFGAAMWQKEAKQRPRPRTK